ncbi:putative virulence-associated protein D [Synechococcus sp. PCC 6312]|uniref:putative virulence-associated protein D n=1 Tax=Synechococcus sp. (strain ATCC 27167 / PCC 6312) TaxID=195253 RepID=UPI00029EC3B7|nr:putative virulence-associated protein D [Synechococcus sp. PCC 6312]AFY60897.1 putative virulence-associated protein D [Synechococcus sp. PCC 6312]
MSSQVLHQELITPPIAYSLNFNRFTNQREVGRVYAIAFDMDIESLKQNYGDPYNNAYAEIRKVLQSHGFSPQQGSVYFGDSTVNAVTCVLAAQDLAKKLPWFAESVRDIRMLRIEEFNDLGPAVQSG